MTAAKGQATLRNVAGNRLVDAVTRASRALGVPDPTMRDVSTLRALQETCDALVLAERDETHALVEFVLSALIADLFSNLFEDTAYSANVERERGLLLDRVATILNRLAEAISKKEQALTVEALGGLVMAYSGTLGKLNSMLGARYGLPR